MNKIIISNHPSNFSHLSSRCKIIDPSSCTTPPSHVWDNYTHEYIPYIICEDIKNVGLVVAIDFSLEDDLKYLLAYQIITTCDDATIFFFSDVVPNNIHLQNDYGLFRCKAIRLTPTETLDQLFAEDESQLIRFSKVYKTEFSYIICKNNYQRFFNLDKHQITNEWGAIKLLLNHQLTLTDIENGYEIPKTVYFKQKLKEYNINDSTTISFTGYVRETEIIDEKLKFAANISKLHKILLIDDNANKGWKFALEKIFPTVSIDVEHYYDDASLITDFSIYDLIFLDLRLPKNTIDSKPEIKNGLLLIEKIKITKSLHVPLLIFTASQKASTLDVILEAGADAMYVKESADFSREDSFDNYLDFIREINFLIYKSENLKNYWNAISSIKNSLLPEIVNNGSLKLKSRIIERLEMFYGLIKTEHEQSKFNAKTFHYSYEKLSFMSLWSILNEIQECYFEKVHSPISLASTGTLRKADGSVFKYLSKWHIKNQVNDIYFEKTNLGLKLLPSGHFKTYTNGDYEISSELFRHLKYDSSTSPYYKTRNSGGAYVKEKIIRPDQTISFQIAFLLREKSQLRVSTSVNSYLISLKKSNDLRNKLYLTHGEDATTTFHTQLERQKTMPPNATLDLFKLIAFLLTGNDSLI